MKIGLRTIKTGIAITLTMLVAAILKTEYPLFAMIAALIAIQPTVMDSWKAGVNRMLGTLIGAGIGLFFVVYIPVNFISGGIGTILVIYIMNRLHWNESINIAVVVFMAIFLNMNEGHLSYAFHRLIDTFIGITVAVVVNYLIYPPNYDAQAQERLKKIADLMWGYHIEALERMLHPVQGIRYFSEQNVEDMNRLLTEAEKWIQLTEKEEKLRAYGRGKQKQLVVMLNLSRSILQNLITVQNVLMKSIHSDLLKEVFEELQAVKEQLKRYHSTEEGVLQEVRQFDFSPSIELLQRAKYRVKTSEEIHRYPADEVVKILVALYNIEEGLTRLKMLMTLVE